MAGGWVKSLQCKTNAADDVHPNPSTPKPKKTKPKPTTTQADLRAKPPSLASFPNLTLLKPTHSSRRVVELIFTSTWSHSHSHSFPGQIDTLFKVHNPTRITTRFEDFRAHVRAVAVDPRCAADGNEMMRFCPPPFPNTTAVGMTSFAGSGAAHERSGGGRRRAMVLCRVIAGRVGIGSDYDPDKYESISRKGELVVFDPRAVLPCFLVIYKV